MPTLTLEAEILKTLVELGQLAATVDEAMNAGPGGMRLGVDVELHGVARIAPGRARLSPAVKPLVAVLGVRVG